eukprot:CAMPEP_0176006922 /NCGR_PEP_ID=MMETSP0120_2-20121206/2969_1 /TAXON_ID=160619 /ORGANISM="Kryptoperidinium foliaceum, Strain CCMP 1326" /LENGTH=304 /DNA_ID=CAMNT_0017339671 /DNA_START=167 /DNA_END=1081 /DNA_ORIENTATION=+
MAKKSKFYAVAKGRKTGIYTSWPECEKQVKGYSGAIYKSFPTSQEAASFVHKNGNCKELPISSESAPSNPRKRPAPKQQKDTAVPEKKSQSILSKRAKKESSSLPGLEFRMNFDGGSRGNPGIAGCGAEVLRRLRKKCPNSQKEVVERSSTRLHRFLKGSHTNNQAEYWGLVTGLERLYEEIMETSPDTLKDLGSVSVTVEGDSQLVVQQMRGNFKVGPELRRVHDQAKEGMRRIEKLCETMHLALDLTLEHVYRNDNKIADECANKAMDAKRSWLVQKNNNGDESRFEMEDANPTGPKTRRKK